MTKARFPTIANQRQLTAAACALGEQCQIMAAIFARTGTPPLRDFTADFAGLAQIVTGQQLSAASAAAIWARVSAAVSPFDASAIRAIAASDLARLGLSPAKIRTLKAVAAAIEEDGFDFAALSAAPDAEVITRLTALHGIGPWTADIYLLFALRRADAFAAGDLALQIAAQRRFKLKDRPAPAKLESLAERWRPWRGAAARLLWADYALDRSSALPAPSRRKR
ncbi:MAG: DNA-3-methyladenine glycosylase 2 family protein [Hyphomicrobium sp.]|nr:DNA-3-methyladenine glycosylase 2 family protein [Hyphomicrobium sp.]